MRTTILMAFIFLAVLTGCKKSTSNNNSYTPSCTGATKSWVSDVKPLMDVNCISCHSSYSAYSSVFSAKSTIRSKIVDGSMPTNGTLSTDQKNNIVCWIDNGAPNN
jgi:hypothetical protein